MDRIKSIKFERTGGFAGIRLAADIEMDDLPEEQVHQLLELMDDADFDELPEQFGSNDQMADGFTYSITVETREHEYTVTTGDMSAPEKLHPLLELLTKIAQQQARKNSSKDN